MQTPDLGGGGRGRGGEGARGRGGEGGAGGVSRAAIAPTTLLCRTPLCTCPIKGKF